MFLGLIIGVLSSSRAEGGLINPSQLKMFVDVLPDMPRIKGFHVVNGVFKSKSLKIGMFNKHWVRISIFYSSSHFHFQCMHYCSC